MYKPTQEIPLYQFTNRKNSPQDIYEMIKNEIAKDEIFFYESAFRETKPALPKLKKPENKIFKSVGWKIFYKNLIKFSMEFRP